MIEAIKKNPLLILFGALFVIAQIVLHWNWLFSFLPLVSGDWPFFYIEPLKAWFPFHTFWIDYDGLGRSITQGNFVFLFSIYALFAKLGLHFEVISRILFFIPVMILAPLASFLAMRTITKHTVASIAGAAVYCFNTYFIVIQGGHMHLSMVYALAPFVYYFAAKDTRWAYVGIFSTLAVTLIYDVRMSLIIAAFGFLIAFFYKVRKPRDALVHIGKIAIGCIVLVLLHSFWLLPQILTKAGPFTKNAFDQDALNWITQPDALVIHHPFWSIDGVTDFVFQPPILVMYVLPLLAFATFMFLRSIHRKEIIFFGGLCLVAILFLVQENSIFALAYRVIYENFPLMSMFRESSKIYFLVAFCYGILIAFLIKELLANDKKLLATLALLLLSVALLIPLKTYLFGDYAKAYQPEPISESTQKINEIIASRDTEQYRTLWLTRTPKFAELTSQNPGIDALDLGQKFWGVYADGYDPLAYLRKPNAPALLNFAGVKYVVVPHYKIDSYYKHFDNLPTAHFQEVAAGLDFPAMANVNGSVIRHNDNYKPHIYFASDVIRSESIRYFSGIDTHRTSAYLFEDQNTSKAKFIQRIARNQELNLLKPEELQVGHGKVAGVGPPLEDGYEIYRNNNRQATKDFETIERDDSAAPVTVEMPNLSANNLYLDGSFENEQTIQVNDCNNYDQTTRAQNGISGKSVADHTEGSKGLRITAQRHTACFSKRIVDFDKNAHYLVSVDYKVHRGKDPSIALYPYSKEPENRRLQLKTSQKDKWHHYQSILDPNQFSDEMFLVFYLEGNGKELSEATIDNLKIIKLPHVPEAYARTKLPPLMELPVETLQDSAVKQVYRVKGLTTPRLLVFSETFNPNWRLTMRKADSKTEFEVDSKNHVVANGFANGWWIDPETLAADIKNNSGDYEVILEYVPQRWFYLGLAIGGATVVGCIFYFVIRWLIERKRQKKFELLKADLYAHEPDGGHFARKAPTLSVPQRPKPRKPKVRIIQ